MVKVDVADILWIESSGDYIKVALINKVLISKQKISVLEELLPDNHFVRVHRSFIIQVAQITKIDSADEVLLKNGVRVPLSRTGYTKLKAVLGL